MSTHLTMSLFRFMQKAWSPLTCSSRQSPSLLKPQSAVPRLPAPMLDFYDPLPSTVGVFERWVGGRCGRRLRVYGAARVGAAGSSRLAAAHPAGAWLVRRGKYVQVCVCIFISCCLFPFFPDLFWLPALPLSDGVARCFSGRSVRFLGMSEALARHVISEEAFPPEMALMCARLVRKLRGSRPAIESPRRMWSVASCCSRKPTGLRHPSCLRHL